MLEKKAVFECYYLYVLQIKGFFWKNSTVVWGNQLYVLFKMH